MQNTNQTFTNLHSRRNFINPAVHIPTNSDRLPDMNQLQTTTATGPNTPFSCAGRIMADTNKYYANCNVLSSAIMKVRKYNKILGTVALQDQEQDMNWYLQLYDVFINQLERFSETLRNSRNFIRHIDAYLQAHIKHLINAPVAGFGLIIHDCLIAYPNFRFWYLSQDTEESNTSYICSFINDVGMDVYVKKEELMQMIQLAFTQYQSMLADMYKKFLKQTRYNNVPVNDYCKQVDKWLKNSMTMKEVTQFESTLLAHIVAADAFPSESQVSLEPAEITNVINRMRAESMRDDIDRQYRTADADEEAVGADEEAVGADEEADE